MLRHYVQIMLKLKRYTDEERKEEESIVRFVSSRRDSTMQSTIDGQWTKNANKKKKKKKQMD